MRYLFILLLANVLFISNSFAQNFNRPSPGRVFKYEFRQYQNLSPAFYFITPFKLRADPGHPDFIMPMPMLLDENGYLLWYMIPAVNTTLFRPFDQPGRYGFTNRTTQKNSYYKVLDEQFYYIDSFTNSPGVYSDLHEFIILPNGNYIIAGAKDSIVDLSNHTFNGVQGSDTTRIIGFIIEEFDVNKNLIFHWNSNDHIDPTETYDAVYGYNAAGFDYCHGNAIEQDIDGNYLVSFRHLNAIYKVNRSTGAVIWILGGKSNNFTFTNDPGFSGQHDIRRLPNGNISLYDNANSSPAPKESRAVEYMLDTVNWTATKVWEYKHNPPFYAFAMGNFQTTGNGNRLINFGFADSFFPNPNISVLDANMNAIADIFLEDSVFNYRAYIYDKPINLPRPEITCSYENGAIHLSAPSGFNDYIWSSGVSTTKISIQAPGDYQVWVNYGIGMLGSEVVTVTNPSADCTFLGISKKITPQPSEITGIFDISGRLVRHPQAGNLYLIRYKSGYAEMKFWNERDRNFLNLK